MSEPEAVTNAKRWLDKDKSADQARDVGLERLATAYDGFLFDLDRNTLGGERRNLASPITDVLDVPSEASEQFHEISANMVLPMIEDWKSIIGILPTVYVPPTHPGDPSSNIAANKRENIIGGIHYDSALPVKFLEGAHYSTLFGCQIPQVVPDFDSRRIRIRVNSPYRCHARVGLDGINLHHLAFDWDEDTDLLAEEYPEIKPIIDKKKSKLGLSTTPGNMVVTEWNDANHRMFLVDGQWIEGLPMVTHNWGFVPAAVIPNIVGTGSLWSRGDAQQVIGLAQTLSEVLSMSHDALFQQVHDQILIFADKPFNQMGIGPFEITQVEKGAQVQLLHGGQSLPAVGNSVAMLERLIRLMGGWPQVMSSEMDSSVISGKAFVAAQGPVAARAAIKHIIMQEYWQRINSYALMLYEKLFPYDEVRLMSVSGGVATSVLPKAGRGASDFVTFVPSQDIAGHYENLLTFPPAGTDRYRQSVEWLQYVEAGVLSINFIRENTPGVDPQAMEKEVLAEFMAKADRQAQAMQMMQPPQPGPGAPPSGAGMAGPAASGPVAGPVAQGPPAAMGGPAAQPAPMAPPMAMEAPTTTVGPNDRVTLGQVRKAFSVVKKVRGQVYLGGALVTSGFTTGPIEVWVTDPQDKGTLISQTAYGRVGRLLFHDASKSMPNEPVVNVTPAGQEAPQEVAANA